MNNRIALIFFLLFSRCALSQQISDKIALNQVGYYNHGPKMAMLIGDSAFHYFYILNGRDTVWKGTLGTARKSNNSALYTKEADFGSLSLSGEYKIYVPGVGFSYNFRIGDTVYRNLSRMALKAFYYQRASMPLLAPFAGKWARAAGHPDTMVIVHGSAAGKFRPEGSTISSPGGWYDAGDYNKYIVNSGISVGTLLSAYEDFPNYFRSLKINIPESVQPCPDILSEVLYNLRWMLTMQDPNDGGVYHKCTNAAFDGMLMPNACVNPRYVVQKGTAAALDFAAVMAQASRIFSGFKNLFPGLSDSCLSAAQNAWSWALKNPSVFYNQDSINLKFSPKISTGTYSDRSFKDEFFWAASELYVSTRDKQYLSYIYELLGERAVLPSWSNVGLLGCYSLMRGYRHSEALLLPDLAKRIRGKLESFADSLIEGYADKAFATVMGNGPHDFIWGSNSVAANQAILFINVYFLNKQKKFIAASLSNLDYLLGRNATGYCFVTGLGTKSPMHPHHRPSIADGIVEPVPGLLVGGPNPGRQDHVVYEFIEPETAYTDQSAAYASNEIAINWNAPLVYLSAAVEALHAEWGLQ